MKCTICKTTNQYHALWCSFNPNNKTKAAKQATRTDEEYKQIAKEGNYQYLTPEDMKWIDENIGNTSDIVLSPEELAELKLKGY